MCGRFSITKELSALGPELAFLARVAFFAPRYNIAPRQHVPVIVREQGRTSARLMRWGLVPSWAADESIGGRLINAMFQQKSFPGRSRRVPAAKRWSINRDSV